MENNYPIIGILSQKIIPISEDLEKNLKDHSSYTSYIAASYVKYIESSGARVVPILLVKSWYYQYFFKLKITIKLQYRKRSTILRENTNKN